MKNLAWGNRGSVQSSGYCIDQYRKKQKTSFMQLLVPGGNLQMGLLFNIVHLINSNKWTQMNPNWTLALVTLSLPILYLVLSCTLTISVKTRMQIHLK